MSKKFNGFESNMIKEALRNHSKKLEAEVASLQSLDKNPIFAPGFFDIAIDDIIKKVDSMTLKKDRNV